MYNCSITSRGKCYFLKWRVPDLSRNSPFVFHGIFFSQQHKCERLCNSISTCVSYEWFEGLHKYSQCQLSSSCTSGFIDPNYNVNNNFVCDLSITQCQEACQDKNGQYGNVAQQSYDTVNGDTPTCHSNGVPSSLWVDRPKGCWGSGHDQFWFNTNTDDSSMCQTGRDNRDDVPGSDFDGKCLGEQSI